MQPYISWSLLILAALSVLYGYTQYRSMAAMGVSARRARVNLPAAALSNMAITLAWSVLGFPLPVFYGLIYVFRAVRLVEGAPFRRKSLFLLNLSYINTLALHLVLIGIAALLQGDTLHALLDSGLWRTMSAAAVLAAGIAEDLFFLFWPDMPSLLSAEAESVEAWPFMSFLWFCTVYLLVDSFLCVVELEPLYPPLFLIGSIAILMYFVVRFLLHIHKIILDEYQKGEHDRLSARLVAAQKYAGMLQRIVDRDALTDAFSRRHLMTRVDALVEAGLPFCLAFLDLDGLKRINDAQGHDAGDRHLIAFTQAMEGRIREEDLLARVGGDEFVVLMPGCGEDAARRRMENIRGALETRRRDGMDLRFSYGVEAFSPEDGESAEALLLRADRAMYRDKAQRR